MFSKSECTRFYPSRPHPNFRGGEGSGKYCGLKIAFFSPLNLGGDVDEGDRGGKIRMLPECGVFTPPGLP